MKKYNQLTSLVLLIALAFTSFFIWKAQAGSSNPKVNIVTIEGNAEHLKPVELYANVSNNQAYGEVPIIQLKNNTINYTEDQPFLQRVDGHLSPFLDELIAEHRSFMRGKTRRANQYIVTDNWVVYTALATDVYWDILKENELRIAILNKQTNEEKEFSIHLKDNVNYFDLHTAYLNYPELSIVLTEYDMNAEAKHVIYTFDFKNPENKLVEQINFTDKIKAEDSFYAGNTFDKTGRFIPFQSFSMTETSEEMYYDQYTDSRKMADYFAYDIEERKFIDIPLFEENKTFLFTDQDHLYVAEDLGEVLEFSEMNPDTETLEPVSNIDLPSFSINKVDLDFYSILDTNKIVSNGKLYINGQQNFKGAYLPVFQVIDLEENETLFFGRLDASNGSDIDNQNIDLIDYRLNPLIN